MIHSKSSLGHSKEVLRKEESKLGFQGRHRRDQQILSISLNMDSERSLNFCFLEEEARAERGTESQVSKRMCHTLGKESQTCALSVVCTTWNSLGRVRAEADRAGPAAGTAAQPHVFSHGSSAAPLCIMAILPRHVLEKLKGSGKILSN